MSASEREMATTRRLVGAFNEALLERMREELVSHEDVISACANILAHHARLLRMSQDALLDFVCEAYDVHAPSAKGGER